MSSLENQLTGKPRVHVLGLGSIGLFTAHALLETTSKPVVTLLLHRESLLDSYQQSGRRIVLETTNGETVSHDGYELEIYKEGRWYTGSTGQDTPTVVDTEIDHLIVSVKAIKTVAALTPLRYRLSRRSTILFLQNGCGMLDEVNERLFPDPEFRPNYITGVVSHGVTLHAPFHVRHMGFAAMSLGLVPHPLQAAETLPATVELNNSREYLLNALPTAPRLNATTYPYLELLQLQFEKLATNAFCNPLCALNDAKNGFLFTIPQTRRKLLTEISNIVLALPELKGTAGVRERFEVDKLEATVCDILMKTSDGTCSMVWDLRAGRETEIEYINGYWVRRGEELGIPTPLNKELVDQILRKNRRRSQK
ncbi:ketopantoate reductase PanE/ApbA C terminal-domain-containing protein [Aspergillus spinulosporus]